MATAFLWMQLATAAQACPMFASPASMQTAMPGCDHMPAAGVDSSHLPLCNAHCVKDHQSVGTDAAPVAPMWALLVYGLGWREPQRHAAVLRAPPQQPASGTPRGAPPLYITYLALRN